MKRRQNRDTFINYKSPTADNIYFEVNARYTDSYAVSQPEYTISRSTAILPKAVDYYVGIQEITIPSSFIPKFVFISQMDETESPYSLRIAAYNAMDVFVRATNTYYIRWDVPAGPGDVFKNQFVDSTNQLFNNGIQIERNNTDKLYFVYSIDFIVQRIQAALTNATQAMDLANGDGAGTTLGIFKYDYCCERFVIQLNNSWNRGNANNLYLDLQISDALHALIPGFPWIRTSLVKDAAINAYRLNTYGLANNTSISNFTPLPNPTGIPALTYLGYWSFWSIIKGITLQKAVKRIIVATGVLPIYPEQNGDTVSDTRQIILSFTPNNLPEERVIHFEAEDEPQWVDFMSDQTLQTMDLKFYWEDIYGNFYPIYLELNDNITIKLRMIKKECKNNFYRSDNFI